MTAGQRTDRARIARLAVRFNRLQEQVGSGRRTTIGVFSPDQLHLIEEALLGQLMAMDTNMVTWLRDVPEPTPRRVEQVEARTARAMGAGA